ncbi:MAG: hypothetical protein VYA30_09525 [Myxococcota bacterium]|nr:hypothetical protein [Myxococcota bacterium]
MSALIITLLANNWLFGPLSTGDVEVRLSTAYTEGRTVVAATELERQSAEFNVGVSLSFTERWIIGLDIPYEMNRQVYESRIFFDRRQLSPIQLRADYLLLQNTQVGLGVRLDQSDGFESTENALRPIRAYFTADPNETATAVNLRHMSQFGQARLGLDCQAEFFTDSARFGLSMTTIGLWQPRLSWLALGASLDGRISGLEEHADRLRLGLIERIGGQTGWAFQLTLSRDLYTDLPFPDSQIVGSLSWRG